MGAKQKVVWFALPAIAVTTAVFIAIGVGLWFFVSQIAGYVCAGFGVYMFVAYAISMVVLARRGDSMGDMAEPLRLSGGERVLDVGCGLGRFSIAVAKVLDSGKVTGVDIWDRAEIPGNSPEAAYAGAEAEGVRDKVEFVEGSVLDLKFDDASFDAATCGSVLNHFKPDDKVAALTQMHRVLKPGGRLLLVEPVRGLATWFAFTPFGFFALRNMDHWKRLVTGAGYIVVAAMRSGPFAVVVAELPRAQARESHGRS